MTNLEEKSRALVARLDGVDPEVLGLAFGSDGLPQLAELRAELRRIARERWLARRPTSLVELLPWLCEEPYAARRYPDACWYGRLPDGRGFCTDGHGLLVIEGAPRRWPRSSDPDRRMTPEQIDAVLNVPGSVGFALPELEGDGALDISVARFDRALLRRWLGHALELAPPQQQPARIILGPLDTSPGRVDGPGWAAVVMGIKR